MAMAYATCAVAAACYPRGYYDKPGHPAFLTHGVVWEERGEAAGFESSDRARVLCRRVKLASLLDDPYAVDDPLGPPTCPVCAKRLGALWSKGGLDGAL